MLNKKQLTLLEKTYEVIFITAVHSTYSTVNNYKIISSKSLSNFLQINVTLYLLMQMLTFQNQVVFLSTGVDLAEQILLIIINEVANAFFQLMHMLFQLVGLD